MWMRRAMLMIAFVMLALALMPGEAEACISLNTCSGGSGIMPMTEAQIIAWLIVPATCYAMLLFLDVVFVNARSAATFNAATGILAPAVAVAAMEGSNSTRLNSTNRGQN